MRFAFGLVGLLVTFLIMAILWANYTKPVAQANKKARAEASQIAGRADDGRPAADTATFVGVEKPGGQLRGIRVTSVDPTGPMAMHFGLAVGDVITKIGMWEVGKDAVVDSAEDARQYLGADAYRADMDLVVERGGREIILPAGRNVPVAPAAAVPAPGQTTLNANTNNTPTQQPQQPAQQQPVAAQQQPSAPPARGNPNHTARGQAEDLLNQLNAAQNRGE